MFRFISSASQFLKSGPMQSKLWSRRFIQSSSTSFFKSDQNTEKKKEMHVLSLDGGGSKGIMESIMLGHIMNLATIMTNNPEDILYSFDESLKIVRDRDILGPLKCGILDKISDHKKLGREPIHPTDAFQYIVGTSTGSLIAYGLVGGKKGSPMSVHEITERYENVIPLLFSRWKIPFLPYNKEPLENFVEELVGNAQAKWLNHEGSCIAGAVAREFNEDIKKPDIMRLFDTDIEIESYTRGTQLVREILLASSCAPYYFEIPSPIGREYFIDGGVGGNCPLAQALPRITDVGPNGLNAEVKSVLSLAPPPLTQKGKIKDSNCRIYNQIKALMYVGFRITDGESVFRTVQGQYPKIPFMRTRPSLPSSSKFKLDENNPVKMKQAMEKELRENLEYLDKIKNSAGMIAVRMIKDEDLKNDHLNIFVKLIKTLKKNREYNAAIYLANNLAERIQYHPRRFSDFSRDHVAFLLEYNQPLLISSRMDLIGI